MCLASRRSDRNRVRGAIVDIFDLLVPNKPLSSFVVGGDVFCLAPKLSPPAKSMEGHTGIANIATVPVD
jgi:hypothetical protein